MNFILAFIGVFLIVNSGEPLFNILGLIMLVFSFQKILESFQTKDEKKFNGFQTDGETFSTETDSTLIKRIKFLIQDRSEIEKYASILAAASIHIAKSDGRISENEIKALRFSIQREFQNEIDDNLIAQIVSVNKEFLQDKNYESIFLSTISIINLFYFYLQNAGWEARIELTSLMFTMIYEVAIADGDISFKEENLFNRLCHQFSIPGAFVLNIKRAAQYNHNVRMGNSNSSNTNYNYATNDNTKLKNSIDLFNLNKNYTLADLEKSWKQMAVMYHPDKFHNAKPEIYELMNKKFIEAKEAYEYLKKLKS